MVAWLTIDEERRWRPKLAPARPLTLPLLKVSLPPGDPARRVPQAARRLRRRGLSRVLPGPGLEDGELLERWGLRAVDPLPLCRAKGADLALALLENVPLRRRVVALRGNSADPAAWSLAEALCPRTGALLLDFDRGGEALADHLQRRYGMPPLSLAQGPEPMVSVELAPRPVQIGRTLRLWGEPDLGGLTLSCRTDLPAQMPRLPFLELLWETGRLAPEQVLVTEEAAFLAEDTP